MAQKGSTGSRKSHKRLGNKKLTPWLMKRFADRALPLAGRSPIGSATLRLTPDSRQRHLGDRSGGSAARTINRASLPLEAWRTARLPLALRVSESVLRKSTLVQSGWPRALSLPLTGQRQGQRRGSEQATHAAADQQRASDGGSWSQKFELSGQSRSLPADEVEHLADETVETYPSILEESPPLATVDVPRLPMRMKERLGATDEHPRLSGASAGLSRLTHIHPMPLITRQMAVLRQREDSDASELSRDGRRGIPNRSIYELEEPRTVAHGQPDGAREPPAQVRPQRQHMDRTQLSRRVLAPITQRMTLRRTPLDTGPHTISENINEQQASLIRFACQPEESGPEAESRSVPAEQGAVSFMASLKTVPSSGDTTVRDDHTLPDLTISERPVALPSKAVPDLQRSLSKRTIAEEVSSGPERPTLHRMRDKSDGTVSRLLPDGEVSPSRPSGVVPYTLTPQLAAAAGQESMEEAVIRGSVSRRGVLSLDTGVGSGPDRGFAEGHTEKPLAYRHPSPIAGTAITPLPVIKMISRAMTMPPWQLLRTTVNVPISAKREDYGFPQGHEYVPSSPSYKYARQPALTLPAISPARPKAGSSAAHSEELFRHMSDGMPQISHSRNHNGSQLALAPVGRTPDTKTEAQAAVPEHRAEKGEEKQGAPDIRVLAREVYPLIKRMIMIERDRHPTWY